MLLLAAIASTGLYYALRPDFCDGIPREMGACSRNRPTFDGNNCAEVGAEWGRQLNQRVVALIEGPQFSGRSSKLLDAEWLTSGLANKHMRDNGITPNCTLDEFYSNGEAHFSAELIAGVGSLMYEGNPTVEFAEWRERSRQSIEVILSMPHLPYD